MAALPSAPFVALFASSWFVLCQGTLELKEKPGKDVTLQCRSPGGADITLIKWSRTDPKTDNGHVFLYRDGSSSKNLQHPYFRGRVELRDPEMKDGDASVILKNVNIKDAGTYECRIGQGNLRRRKRAVSKLISTIRLTVTESGHTAGNKEGGDKEVGDTDGGNKEGGGEKRNVGLMVGLPVFAVLLVAVVGTMIVKKRRGKTAHTGEQTDSLNPPTSG